MPTAYHHDVNEAVGIHVSRQVGDEEQRAIGCERCTQGMEQGGVNACMQASVHASAVLSHAGQAEAACC